VFPLDNFNLALVRIKFVIPDGHAGLTGIAFGYGGNPVIPLNATGYFSGNDEVETLDLTGFPQGVPWSAYLCNLDTIAHAWEVRLFYDYLTVTSPTVVTEPLATSDILSAVTGVPFTP
jgi:hypothetical protein